ncbi:MAG: transglutaminase-like cysteine peptidase [Pseudolabrys sp.]|jgi:predicted transglutaminase-like cysteine proteinase
MPTHHGSWPGDLSVPQPGEFAIELGAQNKDAFGKRYNSSGMTAADISAKWNELQSRILADEAAVAACRASQAACTLATRQFLSIVDLGAQCEGRMRLGWINRAVNMTVRPVSDWVNGYGDFWASPLQTLGSGAGDCQDYAIVKYVALRGLRIPADDLRLIVVQDEKRETGHAAVAVRYVQRWLILDNRTMAIPDAEDVHDYRPLFALDQNGTRAIATASNDLITNR